jgi:hypothetical protein|tara:strand:- start:512 stop:721 length:210 start_codon:yes stop_codon:yes gene_type:complete
MAKNIDDLLVKIYGDEKAAQEALSVGRTAIANWRKWGQFPREKALTIALDARERGLRIRLEDIPILPRK